MALRGGLQRCRRSQPAGFRSLQLSPARRSGGIVRAPHCGDRGGGGRHRRRVLRRSSLWLGRGVLGLAALLALGTTLVSRVLFGRIANESFFKRRVLVYGVGQRTTAMSRLRRRADRRDFEIVGFLQPGGEHVCVPAHRVLGSDADLLDLCDRYEVHEIVMAMEDRRRGFPLRELLECRIAGIEVTELLTFLERATGRVRIDALNPSWMIFGEGFRRDPLRLLSARLLDLLASLLTVVVSLPVMVVTALAIKLEDGWRAPVFYRQARVGLAGHSFDVLKFRSMRTDAERDGQAQWRRRRIHASHASAR